MLGLARRMLSVVSGEEKPSSSSADQAEQSEAGPKLPVASRHLRFEAGAQSAENDKVSEPPGLASPTAAGAETPGSRHHGEGECNPCAWYWKPQGCLRGKECGYCHLCPEGEVKLRKKAKLAAMRGGSTPTSPSPWSGASAKLGKDDSEAEVNDRQPMPSVGSALHGTGECKPCAWFWKPKGCQNGAECRHCHLCPLGEIRQRKKSKDKHSKEEDQDLSWNLPLSVPLEPLKVDIPEARTLDLPEMPGDLQEPQKVAPSPTSALGGDSLPTFKPPPGLAPSPTMASVSSVETPAKLKAKAEGYVEKPEDTSTPLALSLSDMLSPDGSAEDCVTPLRLSDYIGAKPFIPSSALEGGVEQAETPAKLKAKAEGYVEKAEDTSTPMALSLSDMLSPEADEDGVTPLRLSDYIPEPYMFSVPLEGGVEQEARVFPSEGSRLHGTGLCRPCAWFWKPKGCENGKECRHCHLCPQEEIKNRRKAKHLMMQCDQSMASSWNTMMWAAPSLPIAAQP